MKLDGRQLAIVLMVLVALIQGAYGVQITASGGGNGESGSVAMNFDTLKATSVSSQIAINGATITPYTALDGPIAKFEQTHAVKDASGKKASVYVKVMSAPSGLTYSSKVLPKEGNVATLPQVSAEQWLTVPKADSILCTATASYGSLSTGVGLKETKGTATGDYVTLTGYYGKSVATATSVTASQTATSGAANSITINGSAKDTSGSYSVNTPLSGTFTGLSETASIGTTGLTQVVQTGHLHGTFTSTATYKPTTGTTIAKTRNSNYGTDYDLTMVAKKYATGPTAWGSLGYYVKPGTTASKIQGAVNAAQSSDTINVAAGTYKENVVIDKSLTVKGAGCFDTKVDGNKLGSVFKIGTVNSNVDVILSGLGITGGSGSLVGSYTYGGGIYNKGRATIKNCIIFANSATFGGGIYNAGTATITGSTISGNKATEGGGIYNAGTSTVSSSTISWNSAIFGGGIYNAGTATVSSSTISGNSAIFGGGIYNSGTAIIKKGSYIFLNIADSNADGSGKGGGIFKNAHGTLIFQDLSGNIITDPNVINSIVFSNYLKNIGGTLSNIEY